MADWANLPEGLLDLTTQHIHQINDMVVINSVCKSWQYTLSFESLKFPLLMLATDDNQEQPAIEEDPIRRSRCFFDLSTSKIYESDLPEAYARKCLGIGYGWTLTIGFDLKINLLHPFSKKQISLPPQSAFKVPYDFFSETVDAIDLNNLISRAVLSSSPHQECVIMVLYGVRKILAFFRLGSTDKSWIDVKNTIRYLYDDLIYYQSQFYAVNIQGRVVVIDIDNEDDPKVTVIAPLPIGLNRKGKQYLVELSGDLLLITRIYGGSCYDDDTSEAEEDDDKGERVDYYTRDFSVLKMERCEAKDGDNKYPYTWVKLNNLGNKVLFLGNNSSVSFMASSNLKANCIYFTDDNQFLSLRTTGGGHDMGIFNMEDRTIERHYTGTSHSKYCPPLWCI